MEIIRLGYDNIEEAGFDDFSPSTKEERGFKPGLMWWGFIMIPPHSIELKINGNFNLMMMDL